MKFGRIFSFCSCSNNHTKIFWFDSFNYFLQPFSFFSRMDLTGNSNNIIKRSDYYKSSGKEISQLSLGPFAAIGSFRI